MISCLITGSNGFVGSNLKPYLESKGHQVSTLSRKRNSDYSYEQIKISDYDKYNTIIHLAGKAHDLKNVSNDNEYYEVNTELTKKLYDQFLDSNCKTFIYFSSVKAVADVVDNALLENHPYEPKTTYGQSKALAEQYLLSKSLPEDKRLIILRPCMIHGPGNKGNLNLLYTLISKGIPYPLGSFDNKRSFLSIQNLQFIIAQILKNQSIPSGIYNVSDDNEISSNRLVELMAASILKRERVWRVPRKLISMIANIGDLLPLPINSEKLQKLTENYVVSNDKIKKAMGINELPLSTEEGLKNTFESFKN